MSHFAPQRRSTRTATFSATLAAAAIALTACGADAAPSGPTSAPAPAADGAESPSGEARAASSVSEGDRVDPTRTTEVSAVTPRILLSHEGGLTLLDAESGEVVKEQDVPGFTRLSNAGNGKDVLVTTGNGWEVFSTGIQAKAHGDHVHNYESAPGMTGVTFPGEHPGHVVTHNGRTTLFGDGTGAIRTFDSAHLDKATPDLMPVMTEAETEDPHHGVALELSDGTLFTTQGTEDSRNTLQVIDPKTGEVTAETDDCPGSHGEAAAQPTEAGDVVAKLGPDPLNDDDPAPFLDLAGRTRTVPPETLTLATEPSAVVGADYVLLTTKTVALTAATQQIAPYLQHDSVVISLQNGLRNASAIDEALAGAFPSRASRPLVLSGMVPFNVVRTAETQWTQTTSGRPVVKDHPRVDPFVRVAQGGGLRVEVDPDMRAVLFGKLLLNLNNAVNALTGLPLAVELRDRDCRTVLAACQDEALALARRIGISPARMTPLPAAAHVGDDEERPGGDRGLLAGTTSEGRSR